MAFLVRDLGCASTVAVCLLVLCARSRLGEVVGARGRGKG